MEFMQAVMPKDLIEQATNELAFADGNVPAAVGTDVSVAQAVFPQEPVKPNPLAGLSQEEIANLVAQAQAK